jgi:YfiH family protein
MIRHEAGGVPYYTFAAFAGHAQIADAVFTRLGGVSRDPYRSLNVGHSVGDDPRAVEENHRLLQEALQVRESDVVTARQVHSNHVACVTAGDRGRVLPDTDALITGDPGITLLLRFADCLPIFMYDAQRGVIGLGHAGWRGTAAEIARQMVSTMTDAYGSDPASMIVALGPAIGPCCYGVGDDVIGAIGNSLPDWQGAIHPLGNGHFSLDLWEANRQQLRDCGIREVEIGRLCTACHADEFFSHRAEGGRTGRFAALVGIRLPA